MLEAQGLQLSAGGRVRVDDADFAARGGELTVVLGPNGAGKSTLLQGLSGGLKPDAGRATLDGTLLSSLPARELARRRAWLEQHPLRPEGLTALEAVATGAAALRRQAQDAAQQALTLAQCQHLAARRVETLSGGEWQRVTLARALCQLLASDYAGTRFLLLDEPSAALDLGSADALLGSLRQLAREQRLGVVAVLHDLNLALRHADRVVLMDGGRIAAAGPCAEVMQRPRLESLYGVRLAELSDEATALRAFVPLSPGQ